jgi:penicillin-binding protein 2
MSLRLGSHAAIPKNPYRFAMLIAIVAVTIAALGSRMFYLQVVHGPEPMPESTRVRQMTTIQGIPSTRGLIYDATGKVLAENEVAYAVKIVPAELPLAQRAEVTARLASLLGVNQVDIVTAIDSATGSLYDPVRVVGGVPADMARLIQEDPDALPGVHVVLETRRVYHEGSLFGQIVGYAGRISSTQYQALKDEGYYFDDTIGKAGVEKSYESVLRGQYGQQLVGLDDAGKEVPGMVSPVSPEVAGSSLTLSMDAHEQQIALKALSWGVKGARVSQGVLIAMNPQNGEIVAMVNIPSYSNEPFGMGITNAQMQALLTDPNKPLLNKAIAEQVAPGSTFKLVTGTAGLATGKITTATKIRSKPFVEFGGVKFWEWNHVGWGGLNIYQGFAHSSDTFFYQLANMVGLGGLTYWAEQYGFGALTGVDLPGEVTGIVPTNEWKMAAKGSTMAVGEIIQAGIGQGYVAVTPLQLLNAYCAMANGGYLYEPHVVHSITDAQGQVKVIEPTLIRKLAASSDTLKAMRLAARSVVTSRNTYNLADLPVRVAGKTGTAEFGLRDQYGRLPYHQWFIAFTPGDPYKGNFSSTDSKLAVLVFIHGADSAGNTATEVAKYYLMLHYKLPGPVTSPSTPGYLNTWVLKKSNFYGTPNNN